MRRHAFDDGGGGAELLDHLGFKPIAPPDHGCYKRSHWRSERSDISEEPMSSVVHNIVFDCNDPYELAQFWSQVTGQPLAPDDFSGDPEASISQPSGPTLFFCRVPEAKVVKNRVHVCLRPAGPPDAEIDRLLEIGGRLVDDRRQPGGRGFAVLADPEGNEFCVLRRAASDAAASPDAASP
jgi:predicted enzyme related to lactoylglutathione lyase